MGKLLPAKVGIFGQTLTSGIRCANFFTIGNQHLSVWESFWVCGVRKVRVGVRVCHGLARCCWTGGHVWETDWKSVVTTVVNAGGNCGHSSHCWLVTIKGNCCGRGRNTKGAHAKGCGQICQIPRGFSEYNHLSFMAYFAGCMCGSAAEGGGGTGPCLCPESPLCHCNFSGGTNVTHFPMLNTLLQSLLTLLSLNFQ